MSVAASPSPPASPYALNTHPGGTHATIAQLVPDGSDVLDIGCGAGYLGEVLARRGCRVWGLDRDATALARVPAGAYAATAEVDLDTLETLPWPDLDFDVVIAADVLEHTRDARRVLEVLRRHLRPHGPLIVSLPNVAHASVRLGLLLGEFEYRRAGILDATHLRLYTYATARELVEEAGFTVERLLVGSDRFGRVLNSRPALARVLRGLLAYNVVVVARARVRGT